MSTLRPTDSSIPSLARLLSSNDEPSEDERRSVTAAISSLQSEISALESTISARRGPFRILAKPKLSECVSRLSAHKAVLATVRRIPTEVLQKIFSDFGEIDRSKQTWGSYRVHHLPWAITHICRSWREIALSIPEIWARIPRITLRSKARSRRNVDLFQTLLPRSGSAPLTLDIAIWKSRFQLSDDIDDPLLPLILFHSNRIRTLLVTIKDLFDISLLSPLRSNISSLRTLVLSIENSAVLGTHPLVDTFADASSLLTVKVVGEIPTGTSLVFPRGQLISYYERSHFRNNYGSPTPISEYSNLQILQISETHFTNSEVYSGRLEHLRHLSFDKVDWIPSNFLSNIELPAVEVIVLTGGYDHAYRELARMIGRSLDSFVLLAAQSHVLQELYIHSQFKADDGELATLLRLTPNLRHLRIPHIPFPDDLKALIKIGVSSEPDIVPKLIRLVLGSSIPFEGISDLQWELLPSLVLSRCEESIGLRGDFLSVSLAFKTPEALHEAFFRLNGWERGLGNETRPSQISMEHVKLVESLERRVFKCLNSGDEGPSAARSILSSRCLERQLQKICLLDGIGYSQLVHHRIPFLLNQISHLEALLKDTKHATGSKITDIYDTFLEKCGPQLQENFPKTKWFMYLLDAGDFRHTLRLFYVPENDNAVRSRMLVKPKLMISLFQFPEDKKDVVRNYSLFDVSMEHPDDEVYLSDLPVNDTTTLS